MSAVMSAAFVVTGNRNVVLSWTCRVNGVTSRWRWFLLYATANWVASGRAGKTTPDWPMMSWHCSLDRNFTHFAAFSGCFNRVVIESARPLNIDARLPVGPMGVGAMPMSSFLPLASVRLLKVEIIHEPDRPMAAV